MTGRQAPVRVLVTWAARRRGVVLAATAVVLLAAIGGVRHVAFDTNVLHLLPREGAVVRAFETFLDRFGTLDQLSVVFTAPGDRAIDEYEAAIDRFAARLHAAPEIAEVDTGRFDASRNWSYLADRVLLLLDAARLDAALARLRDEGMREALDDSRRLLTVPSPAVAAMVREDPLGLLRLLGEQLDAPGGGLVPAAGGYVSPDGRSRLVVARPTDPPYDTAFSRRLFDRLAQIERESLDEAGPAADEEAGPDPFADDRPPLDVAYAGGHRIAIETAAQVRRESIVNTLGALALILTALLLVFRSPWLLLVGAVPTAVSLVVVLGLLGMAGVALSAASAGAAAMLFGLGVDGVVLLYVTYRLRFDQGATAEEAASRMSGASGSMLLGMWTTAATFYGLTVVDYPSLQQLGLLVGHSMMACGLLTLVLVPALLPKRRPARPLGTLGAPALAAFVGRHARPILAGAVLATAGLGAAALQLDVNPTLERLRATTPGVEAEQAIAERFGLPQELYVAIARGTDLQALLDENAALIEAVRQELPDLPVHGASTLVPPDRRQAVAAARIDDAALSPAVVAAALDRAAEEAGFRAGTFAPFEARLPRLLDVDQRVSPQGYVDHGLGQATSRLITRDDGAWLLATYAQPDGAGQVARLEAIVGAVAPAHRLTGLPLVNAELEARFLPELAKGLSVGAVLVLAMIFLAFRDWRLSLFALAPTVVGLIWAAGLLALARVELDLFAVFAVVTFVGIGVDYGIHLVHRYREHDGDVTRATAELTPVILVAGLLTLLGYGMLLNSSYAPLRSIGVVSVVSVVTLVAASLLVLPAGLHRWTQMNTQRDTRTGEHG